MKPESVDDGSLEKLAEKAAGQTISDRIHMEVISLHDDQSRKIERIVTEELASIHGKVLMAAGLLGLDASTTIEEVIEKVSALSEAGELGNDLLRQASQRAEQAETKVKELSEATAVLEEKIKKAELVLRKIHDQSPIVKIGKSCTDPNCWPCGMWKLADEYFLSANATTPTPVLQAK